MNRRHLLSTAAAFTGVTILQGVAVTAAYAANKGTTRKYYIAAEEVDWDYAPLNRDEMMSKEFDEDQKVFVEAGPSRVGKVYRKALYIRYLDKDFTRRDWDVSPSNGFLGPVIHAEVGDKIVIEFRNKSTKPLSVHPHGVFYKKDAEGAMMNDGTNGADMADDHVAPGGSHVYQWDVPERAGPGPSDPSSVVWLYHSHVDEVRDTYSGPVGAMVISRRGSAKPDGSPTDVDREVFSFFSVMNENLSIYTTEAVEHLEKKPGDDDESFEESNLMHSINGYVYGNMPMPVMKVGERVRWYMMTLGNEVDIHTPHWHGNTVLVGGHRKDVVELMPASTLVADMKPDNPGVWMFHCHVIDHIAAGMTARYEVTGPVDQESARPLTDKSHASLKCQEHQHAASARKRKRQPAEKCISG